MNKKLLILSINNHAKIIMRVNNHKDVLEAGSQVRFIWKNYNHELFLTYNFLSSEMETLKILLNMALKNELQLDPHYTQNIAYYWNHCLNPKNPSDRFGDDYSILKEYLVINSIFIYNNKDGEIVFEITPLYPHTYSYSKRKPSYNYFVKWMQEVYKPIKKCIISPSIAQQWVQQADAILAEIETNTAKMYANGEL